MLPSMLFLVRVSWKIWLIIATVLIPAVCKALRALRVFVSLTHQMKYQREDGNASSEHSDYPRNCLRWAEKKKNKQKKTHK
jgi:hypothetical protein